MSAAVTLKDPAILQRIAAFIAAASGATRVDILRSQPLTGGAIQENWGLDVAVADGPFAGTYDLVLRTDAPSGVAVSRSRAEEFALLKIARAAGVPVPEPLWLATDKTVLGRNFYLMRRMPGIAAGHRLIKTVAGTRGEQVARSLGQALARIHTITPQSVPTIAPEVEVDFLGPPPNGPAADQVEQYRHHLDALGAVRPTLEWALRWLELNAPVSREIVLCHQDFRTGNYLVDDGRLTAILDWEFAAWGDPHADIGWFCAKCWRFGAVGNEAGGIAPRAPFYDAYTATSGRVIDPEEVRYWEVMAHVRWAVIALQQADRHASGRERSLELALTGMIVPELELEVLDLTRPDVAPGAHK